MTASHDNTERSRAKPRPRANHDSTEHSSAKPRAFKGKPQPRANHDSTEHSRAKPRPRANRDSTERSRAKSRPRANYDCTERSRANHNFIPTDVKDRTYADSHAREGWADTFGRVLAGREENETRGGYKILEKCGTDTKRRNKDAAEGQDIRQEANTRILEM